MQAQTEPQTKPCLSSSDLTCAGSMWEVSSTGISIDSKPHFLKVLKRAVLSLVKGDVKRNVLIPSLIMEKINFFQPKTRGASVKNGARTERGLSSPQQRGKKGVAEFFGAVGRSRIA